MKKTILSLLVLSLWSCQNKTQEPSETRIYPLIKDLYSADPSAHVFDGKLYVYPSHDLDAGVPEDDLGSHFDMRDYHVYQISESLEATDLGEILNVNQIPWAEKQLWAPDAATKNGTYYFYFPALSQILILTMDKIKLNKKRLPAKIIRVKIHGKLPV